MESANLEIGEVGNTKLELAKLETAKLESAKLDGFIFSNFNSESFQEFSLINFRASQTNFKKISLFLY